MIDRPGQAWDLVVCIYVCEQHRPLLDDFYRSVLGLYLQQLTDSALFEVYADPRTDRSHRSGRSVIVQAPERYDSLTLKTHEMVRYCAHEFNFRRLLKIDVTTVQARFAGAEYDSRVPLDLDKLVQFLKESPPDRDYDGFRLHAKATRANAEKWASKKGLALHYERIFGERPMIPFFSGKAYLVSRRFAEFIARHGSEMAQEHADYFPAEDVMVGRLFEKFAGGRPLSPS